MKRTIMLAALMLSTTGAFADTYRCTLPSGKTMFSDKPRDGCVSVSVKAAPYNETEAARAADNLRKTEERNRSFDNEQARIQAEKERVFELQMKKREADEARRARQVQEAQLEEQRKMNRRLNCVFGACD